MEGYGSDAAFEAYAEANGLTLPSERNVAAARLRGSIYVDAVYGDRFPGVPVAFAQERAWPRVGALDKYGRAIPVETVPSQVEWASYEAAAAELGASGSLTPASPAGDRVKRKKVDTIEIEYATDASSSRNLRPILPAVDGLLASLLSPSRASILLVV